jgi:hypothetical protein
MAGFTLCSGGTAVQQSTAPKRGFSMCSEDASGLLCAKSGSNRTSPSIAHHAASLEMHITTCQCAGRVSAVLDTRYSIYRVDGSCSAKDLPRDGKQISLNPSVVLVLLRYVIGCERNAFVRNHLLGPTLSTSDLLRECKCDAQAIPVLAHTHY